MADVNTAVRETKRLNRPQLRVFLHFMGVRMSRHPNTVGALHALAEKLATEQPDKAAGAAHLIYTGGRTQSQQVTATPDTFNVDELKENVVTDLYAKLGFKAGQVQELLKSTLNEEMFKAIRAEALAEAKKHQTLQVKIGRQTNKVDGVLPECFEDMVKLASSRVNIMLVGPSGSGKTFLAGKLAEALGLDFAAQSCSVGMSEAQLAGWLLPSKGMEMKYVPSQFVKLYENGGVFLLDEMDAADENTLIFINAALAGTEFYLPQRANKPMVKRHKDFVCVGACNTFGLGENELYTGRNALDGATLDRFRAGVLFIDYDARVEEALIHPDVLAWGRKIRTAIKTNSLSRIMSTRVMLELTKMTNDHGWAKAEWERTYFADWSTSERAKVQ